MNLDPKTEKPLFLILLVFLLFARILSFDFVNLDDTSHLDHNPHLGSWEGLTEIWTHPYLNLYIPFTYSIWSLESVVSRNHSPSAKAKTITGVPKAFAYRPFLFHLTNLLLHLVACLLVYLILLHLFIDPWPAFLGSLLFAVHPVQVEPVAWVSGLKDVLSGVLGLTWIYLMLQHWGPIPRGREKRKPRRLPRSRLALLVVVFLAALLSKPGVVILPLLLLTLGYYFYSFKRRRLFSELGPWLLAALPVAFITATSQNNDAMNFVAPEFWKRPFIAGDAIGFYIQKILFPLSLTFDYGRTPSAAMVFPGLALSLGVASFTCAVFWWLGRGELRALRAAGVFFVAALLPVLGFKSFLYQTTSTVSDRYLYLAMLGPAMAAAALARRYAKQPKFQWMALTIVAVLGLRSEVQLSHWKNSVSLFEHALAETPNSWLAQNNLGSAYERIENWEKALLHYTEAARLNPQPSFYNNLGAILMAEKRYKDAIATYERSASLSSAPAPDYYNIGLAWLALGNRSDAEASFRKVLSLDPQYTPAKNALQALKSH